MRLSKAFTAALCASLCLITLAGCETEGPAEKAGEEIDQALEGASKAAEEAGEKLKQATE